MSKVFAALFFKKGKNRLTLRPGFPAGFSFNFDAIDGELIYACKIRLSGETCIFIQV